MAIVVLFFNVVILSGCICKANFQFFQIFQFSNCLLHTLHGILGTGTVHVLSFEKRNIHFSKAVSKIHSHELWVADPIVLLGKQVRLIRILVRPSAAKDITDRYTDGSGIVFKETSAQGGIHRPVG